MGAPVNKSTDIAFLIVNNCRTVPGVTGRFIGGQKETDPTVTNKYNQWRQVFGQVDLTGHSIVGCNTILAT